MKYSRLGFLSLSILFIASSGCHFLGLERFVPYVRLYFDEDNYEEVRGEGYYKPASYSSLPYYDCYSKSWKEITTYDEMFTTRTSAYWRTSLISTNESDQSRTMLVIPINFKDVTFSQSGLSNAKVKTNLQNAFFGKSEATSWESVASFYNRTSYGKFSLTGKVADPFTPSKTCEQLKSSSRAETYNIAKEAVEDYFEEFPQDKAYFDQNNDGRVDALYLIYSADVINPEEDDDSIFWAFTTFQNSGDLIGNFSWTSYFQLNEDIGYTDTHVLVHETGHLFGLPDYYNTNDGKTTPTGRLEMMDYSIGDHSALTKILLNWTRPYVVTGNATMKIRPLTQSGDVILIPHPRGWNGSMFDEYLLIEYYAPTGFNYPSSYISFATPNGQIETASMPRLPGIKIYHVDASLAYFHVTGAGSMNLLHALDDSYIPSDNAYWLDLMYDNNSSTHPFYLLLEHNESNRFLNGGGTFDNSSLFIEGDDFGISTYEDFTFYDGSALNFTISIEDINNFDATIKIMTK